MSCEQGTDFQSLDSGTAKAVTDMLSSIVKPQVPCVTTSSSAGASFFGGLFSAGAGASTAVGCDTLALSLSNTTSAIVNSLCQLQSIVLSQTLNASATQTIVVDIRVLGNATFTNGASLGASQSMLWNLSADFHIGLEDVSVIITELSNAVLNDLVGNVNNAVDGAAMMTDQTILNAVNNVVTQVSNNTRVVNTAIDNMMTLNTAQSQTITYTFEGDLVVDGNSGFNQDMIVNNVLTSTIAGIVQSIVETVVANEVTNSLLTDVQNDLRGFNANYLGEDVWVTILIVAVAAVVIAGGYFYFKQKDNGGKENGGTN